MTIAIRVLSQRQAASALGVHVATLRRWEASGAFVPKVQLGPRRVGYLEADVNTWVAQRRRAA